MLFAVLLVVSMSGIVFANGGSTVADVESSDSDGNVLNIFQPGDRVYVIGSNYSSNKVYNLYVVDDTTWSDGMNIPQRVPGTVTTVTTDGSGNIPKGTEIWSSAAIGKYDIVVDVNEDGKYNSDTDALDANMDVGFETIPEFTTIAIPTAMILGIVFLMQKRKLR